MISSSKTKMLSYLLVSFVAITVYLLAGNPKILSQYYKQASMTNRIRNKQLRPLNNELQKELVFNLLLLDEQKNNIDAWFKVAKIYELQHQYHLAQDAYYNLMNLDPQNEFFFKQFIKMSTKDTNGLLTEEIRAKLMLKLKKQQDITYLLAIDAYNQQEFVLAANYWSQVYSLAQKGDANNETLTDIKILIEKCNEKLKS